MTKRLFLLITPVALLLAGCSAEKAEAPPVIRPVLTAVTETEAASTPHFVGVVTARSSVTLSFRAGGTLLTRQVETGNAVKKGDVLATLDSTTSELALQTARANLGTAEAQYANAAAAEARLRALNQSDVVTLANLEQAEQQTSSAQAALAQARAGVSQAEEQVAYATLVAPMDGIITSVAAEPGSVVGAGQTIVTLADPTTRDVVIDVPEAIVDQIGTGTSFVIAPQLAPDVRVAGRVREIAPQAHPVTRTWRVKIAIDKQAEQFWLGTTATAAIEGSRGDRLSVPASAIRREGAQAFVFVLDEAAAQVRKRPVEIEEPGTDGRAVVTSGLDTGETVVIAGVNSLGDGQQVKLTQESAK